MSTPTILFFLGAPGSGKTTLARQAHAALAPQFGDQTCFCEMSDLVDAVENAGDDLGKLIKEHLKERKPIPPSVLVDIVWAGMQLPAPPPTALQTVQPLLSTTNEQPTEGASGSVHLPPQTEAGMSTSNTDYTVQQTSAEALQPQPETVSTTSTAQHTQADCAASLRTSVNAEGTSGSMQLPPQTAASGTSGADTLEQPSTQSVQDRMGATPTQDISAAALEPPAKGQSSSTQLGGEPGSGPKAAEPEASGGPTQNENETQQQQPPAPSPTNITVTNPVDATSVSSNSTTSVVLDSTQASPQPPTQVEHATAVPTSVRSTVPAPTAPSGPITITASPPDGAATTTLAASTSGPSQEPPQVTPVSSHSAPQDPTQLVDPALASQVRDALGDATAGPQTRVPLAPSMAIHGAPNQQAYKQSGVHAILPKALKVHPRGFKVLSTRSPIERSLKSYFRLPALPPVAQVKEAERLQHMIKLSKEKKRKELVLDGFILLEACGMEDPEEAIEGTLTDVNLTKVVQEDMAFFTNLEYLDLGENNIQFEELAPLGGLQELHLHCNKLSYIVVPAAAFQVLETLNLSFNLLHGTVFDELAKLPALARLDLSCNGIHLLPKDMSYLNKLTQLALENNSLMKDSTFTALSTMPCLKEVNLNSNRLQRVPRLHPGGFPQLEVLGLAGNRFEFFEDLFPLTEYPVLKRVVLWNNPIQQRMKDLQILNYELHQVDITLITEGPIPPKRKVGQFYTVNVQKMVKIDSFKDRIKKKPKQPPTRKGGKAEADGPLAETFFITGGASLGGGPDVLKPHPPPASLAAETISTETPQKLIRDPSASDGDSAADRSHHKYDGQGSYNALTYGEDEEREDGLSGEPTDMALAVQGLKELLGDTPDDLLMPVPTASRKLAMLKRPRRVRHSNARSALRELKHILQHPPTITPVPNSNFAKTTRAHTLRAQQIKGSVTIHQNSLELPPRHGLTM